MKTLQTKTNVRNRVEESLREQTLLNFPRFLLLPNGCERIPNHITLLAFTRIDLLRRGMGLQCNKVGNMATSVKFYELDGKFPSIPEFSFSTSIERSFLFITIATKLIPTVVKMQFDSSSQAYRMSSCTWPSGEDRRLSQLGDGNLAPKLNWKFRFLVYPLR